MGIGIKTCSVNAAFVIFLKPFLNIFCSVAGCIVLVKEAVAIREHHWRGLCGLQQSVGGTCQSNIHMNARKQGFPLPRLEHDNASTGLPILISNDIVLMFIDIPSS